MGPEALQQLTAISRAFDELLNRAPNRHAPYVGASAFATKAGIHASALAKDPRTYEHVPPESVGNQRAILISNQAGRSNLLSELKRVGIEADPNDPRVQRLLDVVKERESLGYAYEAADASFELLARSVLDGVPEFFAVESFHVGVERKLVAPGVMYSASQAVVKIRIGEERLISAAEGNGPVNALDLALRKDLGVYQRHIEDLELRDYRVRVFQGGTDAVTRVLIEFGDGAGETWSTVGVSATSSTPRSRLWSTPSHIASSGSACRRSSIRQKVDRRSSITSDLGPETMARPSQLPTRAPLTEEQASSASYVERDEHKATRWWGGLPRAKIGPSGVATRFRKRSGRRYADWLVQESKSSPRAGSGRRFRSGSTDFTKATRYILSIFGSVTNTVNSGSDFVLIVSPAPIRAGQSTRRRRLQLLADWLDDATNAAPEEQATVANVRITIGNQNVTQHLFENSYYSIM